MGELDDGEGVAELLAALLAALLEAAPWVPDGDGPNATYPKRPEDWSPQFSYG